VKTIEYKTLARYSPDKMQKNALFASDRMTIDLYCFEPGQAQRSHKHDDCDKAYVILQGAGRFTVGRTTRELKSGMAVLVSAGEEHGVINMAEERLLVLVVMAPPGAKI
jgi:mannose-6-phosphate isomerase-like protein (cupin superfamily)